MTSVARSQIEPISVEQLRAQHQAALEEALRSGKIPQAFEGDPTFRAELERRKNSAQ